jgi:integrase
MRTRKKAPIFWNSLGWLDSDKLRLVHLHVLMLILQPDRLITFRWKTATGFAVPIFPQVRPLLERLCQGKAHNERDFKIADAKKALAGVCRRLGFPPFSQRSLRRMFITRAIEKGVDVKVIAEWQGHEDGGKLILQTYSHVNPVHSNRMAQLLTLDQPQNLIELSGVA